MSMWLEQLSKTVREASVGVRAAAFAQPGIQSMPLRLCRGQKERVSCDRSLAARSDERSCKCGVLLATSIVGSRVEKYRSHGNNEK